MVPWTVETAGTVRGVQRDSDAAFLVLHALRLKGFADTPAIRALAGVDDADVAKILDAAATEHLVTRREGRISGWALTPAGRSQHKDLVAKELTDQGVREAIDDAYRRFLTVNTDLLQVCTDWQLRHGALNDHTDTDYDQGVIQRLGGVDDVVQPVCADLAAALTRFGTYGPRLAEARGRVEAGEVDWIAKPMIDSYHTVWFELHEDLLVTLGIERSKEGAS